MSTRRCRCDETLPFMKMVDNPAVGNFDATAFVTYNNEQDATPTERELVEELPEYKLSPTMQAIADGKEIEKPLRRGVGYLRTEVDDQDTSDFGEGISEPNEAGGAQVAPMDRLSVPKDGPSNSASSDSPEGVSESGSSEEPKSPKRRRRRSRRRKNRDSVDTPQTSAPSTTPVPLDTAPQSTSENTTLSTPQATTESASADGEGKEGSDAEEGAKKKRRRRRRRRRGGNKPDGPSASSTASTE